MNKLLIAIIVLGAAVVLIFLMGANSEDLSEDFQLSDEVSSEEATEALKETSKRTVYGSCNSIATASTCIDYVGSVWAENNMAELNCEGVGIFSRNTCPYSEYGGCQTGMGTIMEIIAWVYKDGPGGYDDESVPYARMACDANPAVNWTLPDDLLE